MDRMTIYRWYQDDCTIGMLEYRDFKCFTLELPDLYNAKDVSCIPEGTYKAKIHISPKFGKCLSIPQVKNRTHILIHPGNYATPDKLQGCILVGDSIKFLNDDQIPDVTNSRTTLKEILSIVPKDFDLHIYG